MAHADSKTEKTLKTGPFAVVMTGGKQYKVSSGDVITIEKLSDEHKKGDAVTFENVILTDDGSTTKIGTPHIAGTKVTGTVEDVGRAAKVVVIKYKQKSRYFVKNGHRQPFVKVKIDKIA